MHTLVPNLTQIPLYTLIATSAAALAIALFIMPLFKKSSFVLHGKICYIPGGSSGLGKALAIDLVKRGAHVVIVARERKKLDETEALLKTLAGPDRIIRSISADLTSAESSKNALKQAAESFNGQCPDYVFLSAGFSKPQLFVDATPEDLQSGLDGVYWVSAWTAHAAAKLMISQRKRGKIVFVSSFLGYVSFAGYSTYSPAKFAVRGLADSLRSEMLLHGIDIHLYMPAGILTPGYDVEQKTKHAITKKIEEGDTPISAEACSSILLKGIAKGRYQITNDLITDLIRLQSRGSTPGNGLMDFAYWLIGGIGVPIWRMITDHQVRAARPGVEAELSKRGFFVDTK